MASLTLGLGGAAIGAEIGSFFPGFGTLAGAAIGMAIGGALGAAAGGVIDQTLLFPAIFGRDSHTMFGPKIADFQFTTANPGTNINFCMGRQNRVPGCVIWMSPIKQESHDNAVGGKGGGNVISFEYFMSIAVAISEGPVNAVRKVWADGKLIYDEGNKDIRYDSITFYDGTQTTTDPTIESFEGVGNVPAFVGISFMVISNLALQDWGNRVPNFTFLQEAQEQCLLGDAIELIWTRSGRPTSEVDTSWVRDVEVQGYTISGPQAATKMLEPLLMTFDVVAQEIDGIVQFKHRKDFTPYVVDPSQLAASQENTGDPIRAVKFTDTATFDLPAKVVVTYLDPVMSWQKGAQRAKKFTSQSPVAVAVDLPLTIDGNSAKALAKRILWASYAERYALEASLMPQNVHLLESDLLQMTADGATYLCRASKVDRGNNFIIQVNGSSEQQAVLSQTGIADLPITGADPSPQGQALHNLVMMELPRLVYSDGVYARGLHWAVFRANAGDTWSGGRIVISQDNITYEIWSEGETYRTESEGGVCNTALLAAGPTNFWDEDNTLTVTMTNGVPVTRPEHDVLNFFNHAYVGKNDGTGEVIAFCNVTQIGVNQYQLQKILRGRYGTEDRQTGHLIGDFFIILTTSSAIRFANYAIDHTGLTFYYKAIPQNMHQTDVTAVTALRSARSVTPWSPSQLAATWNGSGTDITITWQRRPNTIFNIFNFPDAGDPVNEFSSLEYDIEIVNPSGGVVVRSWRAYQYETLTYLAANWAADGSLNPFYVNVYQLNRGLGLNNGRGIVATQLITL